MSPVRQWSEGADPLVFEPEVVRRKGLHAFRRPGLNDRLPLLRARGQELFSDVLIDHGLFTLLVRLLGRATVDLELPNEIPVVQRRSIDPSRHVEAAVALFALELSSSPPLLKRQEAAAATYDNAEITVNVFRQQLEKPIIVELARCVRALEPDRRIEKPRAQIVVRTELYAEAQQILNSKRRLALVGEAGTGKTTLAKTLADDAQPSASFVIRSGKYFMDDIVKVLSAYNGRTVGSDAALRHNFAMLMQQEPVLLIVFDGVYDWSDLDQFITDNIQCQVIVTGNR